MVSALEISQPSLQDVYKRQVLRYREELRARLDEAENSDEKKTVLMKELKSLRSSLLESCARLTEARTIKAA